MMFDFLDLIATVATLQSLSRYFLSQIRPTPHVVSQCAGLVWVRVWVCPLHFVSVSVLDRTGLARVTAPVRYPRSRRPVTPPRPDAIHSPTAPALERHSAEPGRRRRRRTPPRSSLSTAGPAGRDSLIARHAPVRKVCAVGGKLRLVAGRAIPCGGVGVGILSVTVGPLSVGMDGGG